MWQNLVGVRSRAKENWIERGAVRRFAEAIGDPQPVYCDEDTALRGRHGGLVAPPTFAITLDYGAIEGLILPAAGLLHGEQRIEAARPLRVGERIVGESVLEDCYDKRGRHGLLTFVVVGQTGTADNGDVVVRLRRVLIVTEAAMRGMMS